MSNYFSAGSDAAKERAMKRAKSVALTKEQEDMLKKMFYEDSIQTGRDKTHHYLKSKYPDNHPTTYQVQKWLMQQEQYQIDRRPKNSKEIKSINHNIKKPRQLFFADLIQRQIGEKATYILLVVDAFTRKIWTRIVPKINNKTKTAGATAKMMEQIIISAGKNKYSTSHDSFVLYAVDDGSEFKGAFKELMKKNNIKQVVLVPGRPMGNLAERYNQSFQNIAWKKAAAKGHLIATDLAESTDNLNNLHNRSIGMTPNEAEALSLQEIKELATKLAKNVRPSAKNRDDIKVGDFVRRKNTNKYKGGVGVKFFTENFSRSVFIVSKIRKPKVESTRAITYKIKDIEGEEYPVNYTREDLLLLPPETEAKIDEQEKEQLAEELKQRREPTVAKSKPPKTPKEKPPNKYKYKQGSTIIAKRGFFDYDGNTYKPPNARIKNIEGKITQTLNDKYYIKWLGDTDTYSYSREEIESDTDISSKQ